MAQLPVYVINLDRRQDRLATITRDLDRLGLSFERVAATDARCIEYNGPLTRGEAACAMSHCAALRMFLDTDHDAAIIMEDDITMSSDIKALLTGTDWWPQQACLFKLDIPGEKRRRRRICGRPVGKTPTGRTLHPVMLRQTGAGAYLVSRSAAKRIIGEGRSLTLPIDRILFDLRLSKTARTMRPLQVLPAMVIHDHEGSDLQAERLSAGRYRTPRRLLVRSYARKVWVFALLLVGQVRRCDIPFSERL